MQEQQSQGQPIEAGRDQHERHFKTLAVRVEESLHAQLHFIAQLSGTNITEEIRRAIEHRLASAQEDPALIARAEQVRDQIEREAAARSAAIAGFIGTTTVAATDPSTPKPRRPAKPASE